MFAQDYELERLTNIMQSPLVFNKGFPLSAICFCFVAGFALQAYRGTQKPSPMEVMKTQTTRLSDSPATQAAAPPKMEIPTMESRRQGARPHKLKPRDMNILTPSGFWHVRRRPLHPVTSHLKCQSNLHSHASVTRVLRGSIIHCVWAFYLLAKTFELLVQVTRWPQ